MPAANRSIFVNRVTVVGHDDTAPAGQQDSFMLDGTTLARGQISPDGSAITLATAQKTPGVGPVTDGVDLVNLATPVAPPRDNTPYYVGAALAVAAVAGGVFWWVWRKGRSRQRTAQAVTTRLPNSGEHKPLRKALTAIPIHECEVLVEQSKQFGERQGGQQKSQLTETEVVGGAPVIGVLGGAEHRQRRPGVLRRGPRLVGVLRRVKHVGVRELHPGVRVLG